MLSIIILKLGFSTFNYCHHGLSWASQSYQHTVFMTHTHTQMCLWRVTQLPLIFSLSVVRATQQQRQIPPKTYTQIMNTNKWARNWWNVKKKKKKVKQRLILTSLANMFHLYYWKLRFLTERQTRLKDASELLQYYVELEENISLLPWLALVPPH